MSSAAFCVGEDKNAKDGRKRRKPDGETPGELSEIRDRRTAGISRAVDG